MDIPVLSQSRLQTRGITQPVAASTAIAAIAPGSHPSGSEMKRERNNTLAQPRRGEENVDISELARLLAKGLRR